MAFDPSTATLVEEEPTGFDPSTAVLVEEPVSGSAQFNTPPSNFSVVPMLPGESHEAWVARATAILDQMGGGPPKAQQFDPSTALEAGSREEIIRSATFMDKAQELRSRAADELGRMANVGITKEPTRLINPEAISSGIGVLRRAGYPLQPVSDIEQGAIDSIAEQASNMIAPESIPALAAGVATLPAFIGHRILSAPEQYGRILEAARSGDEKALTKAITNELLPDLMAFFGGKAAVKALKKGKGGENLNEQRQQQRSQPQGGPVEPADPLAGPDGNLPEGAGGSGRQGQSGQGAGGRGGVGDDSQGAKGTKGENLQEEVAPIKSFSELPENFVPAPATPALNIVDPAEVGSNLGAFDQLNTMLQPKLPSGARVMPDATATFEIQPKKSPKDVYIDENGKEWRVEEYDPSRNRLYLFDKGVVQASDKLTLTADPKTSSITYREPTAARGGTPTATTVRKTSVIPEQPGMAVDRNIQTAVDWMDANHPELMKHVDRVRVATGEDLKSSRQKGGKYAGGGLWVYPDGTTEIVLPTTLRSVHDVVRLIGEEAYHAESSKLRPEEWNAAAETKTPQEYQASIEEQKAGAFGKDAAQRFRRELLAKEDAARAKSNASGTAKTGTPVGEPTAARPPTAPATQTAGTPLGPRDGTVAPPPVAGDVPLPADTATDVPGFGPGAASAKERLAQYEQRKFAERFQEDQAIAEQIREGTGNRFYEPIPNKITAAEAAALVNERPIAAVIEAIKDRKSDLPFHIRVTMGQLVIKRLNEAFERLKDIDPKSAERVMDEAIDMAEWVGEFGTELGQGVQAFAMWDRLTPEGKLRSVQRMVKKTVDRFKAEHGEEVKAITDEIKAAESPADKAKAKGERKASEKEKDDLIDREANRIAAHLSDTPTWKAMVKRKPNEVLALIRAHLKSPQHEFISRLEEFGATNELANSIDRMAIDNRRRIEAIDTARKVQRLEGKFAGIADRIARQLSDTPEFKGGKGQMDPARELIKQHLVEPQADFQKRMIDYGATPETAAQLDRMAMNNRSRVLAVTRARRIEALRSQFNRNPVAKKLDRPTWEKLVELGDLGLLTDEAFYNAAASKLGLPEWNPATAREILRLAKNAEGKPEGIPRNDALMELNKFIGNLKGFDPRDVPIGVYYGNMLSGYNTQIVNALDTFLNVTSEATGMALSNPRSAARIYSNLLRGFNEGRIDFLQALTKGRFATDGKWLESPRLMEVAHFGEKGGVPIKTDTRTGTVIKAIAESRPAKILNGWKYVGRLMAATDGMMFRGAKEARAALLADRIGRKEGLTGNALDRRVDEILGTSRERTQSFEEQATDEGYTGHDYAARVQELREMSRHPDIRADSTEYAGVASYNHKPTGWLGAAADMVGKYSNQYPLMKLFVPFTRIVANVTNRGINYTPQGFLRARKLKGDERAAMIARATIGTTAVGGLLAMQASGFIDIHGAGPDDPVRRKQLEDAGWKPYTIQRGKNYYSYTYTPMGLFLSTAGNMMDTYRYKNMDEKSALERVGYGVSRLGSTVFSQSFLNGMSSLFDLLGQPEESVAAGKRMISSTVGGFTTPRILNDVYRLFDSKRYSGDTVAGNLLRYTPVTALVNRPALNAFGEPSTFPSNRFISRQQVDPAWQMVIRQNIRVSIPDKQTTMPTDDKGGKRTITPQEYYTLLERSGKKLKAHVNANMDKFNGYDHDTAQKALNQAAEAIRAGELYKLRVEAFNSRPR